MTGGSGAEGSTAGPDSISRFNDLPPDIAFDELLSCCASTTWAARVAAGRPYSSANAGILVSDEAVAKLSLTDLKQALSGHPRIGERSPERADRHAPAGASARATAWSHREQSGVRAADAATMRSLAELNQEYERRFDHIYLVCAAGRTAGELADIVRERLGNDAGTEWLVVRSELQKINRIRLARSAGRRRVNAVSTHVLDTARGRPAAGLPVRLDSLVGSDTTEVGRTVTDADGRVSELVPNELEPGRYRLVFDTEAYFAGHAAAEPAGANSAGPPLYPEVAITFTVTDPAAHYHLPLLLSPFGYSTYRGS